MLGLAGCLFVCLVGSVSCSWLVCCLVSWLAGWLAGWLTWLACWLAWLAGLAGWWVGWPLNPRLRCFTLWAWYSTLWQAASSGALAWRRLRQNGSQCRWSILRPIFDRGPELNLFAPFFLLDTTSKLQLLTRNPVTLSWTPFFPRQQKISICIFEGGLFRLVFFGKPKGSGSSLWALYVDLGLGGCLEGPATFSHFGTTSHPGFYRCRVLIVNPA